MIGQTISHYKILEKLGQGGMGVVYKAEDIRLKRLVALKFLPHEASTGGVQRERFMLEAQAASALNHPNVATIYGIDEAEGEAFIAMEYVDGVTLRKRIGDHPFTMPEAIQVAIQIAEALCEAHANGLVHRDIKSENIMINTRGQVKVMDFGLAKLKGSIGMTRPSEAIGTIAYMAPEQLLGSPADVRSDIFSFGVVFYELLSGRRPFRGEHEAAIMYSIVHEDSAPLSVLNTQVPAGIDQVIRTALEKDPARRYQTADELLRELRSASVMEHPPSVRERSIAVLPFDNISPDKENEYFSDGLTEEIIANLSKIKTLKVISRTSVMRFKGTTKPLREIARELQVQYVLEGSVRKHANDLRITAQLINASDDSHVWTEKYRGTIEDIFDIQERVAGEIAQALKVQLTEDEHIQLKKRHTGDTDAYQHYLKGRFLWNRRTESGVRKGIEHFEEAIRIDPGFALAHVGLADSYNILGFYSYAPPREVFPKAKEAALKALAIDGGLSEAHTSLGYVLHYFDWNWNEAEREFKRAIELDPNYPTAPHFYANYLVAMGRVEESLAAFARAHSLEPFSMIINAGTAWALYFARRYEEAIDQCKRTLELDDNFAVGHQWLARAYVQTGRSIEAVAEFERTLALTGRNPGVLSELAHAYAGMGKQGETMRILDELETLRGHRYISPYHIADVRVALGDVAGAFVLLDQAVEDRCRELVLLNLEPRLDPLRGDSRFDVLLKRVGLVKG